MEAIPNPGADSPHEGGEKRRKKWSELSLSEKIAGVALLVSAPFGTKKETAASDEDPVWKFIKGLRKEERRRSPEDADRLRGASKELRTIPPGKWSELSGWGKAGGIAGLVVLANLGLVSKVMTKLGDWLMNYASRDKNDILHGEYFRKGYRLFSRDSGKKEKS